MFCTNWGAYLQKIFFFKYLYIILISFSNVYHNTFEEFDAHNLIFFLVSNSIYFKNLITANL